MLTFLDAGNFGVFEPEQVEVLIVEADEAFRRNLSERLRREGAVVFEAGNEPEARDIAQKHNIDVVLSISHVITVLHQGSVIAQGDPEEIQGNQKVQDAYLGGY